MTREDRHDVESGARDGRVELGDDNLALVVGGDGDPTDPTPGESRGKASPKLM